ncbi:hypothetical protein DFJ74DRAFT_527897 [Hyaloraphidium curvatum]|nr:hypothetical protein DFJ74DRAFT_527897 [Hyaloraphidium curvatum]
MTCATIAIVARIHFEDWRYTGPGATCWPPLCGSENPRGRASRGGGPFPGPRSAPLELFGAPAATWTWVSQRAGRGLLRALGGAKSTLEVGKTMRASGGGAGPPGGGVPPRKAPMFTIDLTLDSDEDGEAVSAPGSAQVGPSFNDAVDPRPTARPVQEVVSAPAKRMHENASSGWAAGPP